MKKLIFVLFLILNASFYVNAENLERNNQAISKF